MGSCWYEYGVAPVGSRSFGFGPGPDQRKIVGPRLGPDRIRVRVRTYLRALVWGMVVSVSVALHAIQMDVGLRVIRVGGCGWACSSDV